MNRANGDKEINLQIVREALDGNESPVKERN